MCHPLMLSHVDVDLAVEEGGVRIVASGGLNGPTGVEMEALTAATVAALTVYDMMKALDKSIEIQDVYLLEKTGGKSGDFQGEAAVLTVSDSVHAGTREDVSGATLRARSGKAGWSLYPALCRTWPIRSHRSCNRWVRSGEVDAIFTTGGTGSCATRCNARGNAVCNRREIPGIAEWMRSEGMKKTPLAILSRGVAGTCGKCVILNLPGRPEEPASRSKAYYTSYRISLIY